MARLFVFNEAASHSMAASGTKGKASKGRTTRKTTSRRSIKKQLGIQRVSSIESQSGRPRRIRRRRSSTNQGDREDETPTFYQQASGSRQQATQRPDRLGTPDNSDEDEEGGGASGLSSEKPDEERNKSLGKIFALTIWPWPSSSWWIVNRRNTNPTSDPDFKERDRFITFLAIDMGLETDEWTRMAFQQEVLFLSHFYTT